MRALKTPAVCPNLAPHKTGQLFAVHTEYQPRKTQMKNPLDSIFGTIASGLVLTLILAVIVAKFLVV